MLAEERRRKILELTQRDGRVVVKDLARRFSTSLITIRKDLESLHQMGRLQRAHGGALPLDASALRDPTLGEKEQLHRREKLKIAAAAANFVRPGHVVILDSGTTTTAVARAIKHIRDLTVITNAVNIAAELAGTDVEVILTGGVLRRNSFSLVGPLAEDSLRHVTADLLFLGGGWIRCRLRTHDAQSARSAGQSRDDGKRQDHHHRLRFQQIRPPQPFFYCADFGGSSHHHRQENFAPSTCERFALRGSK